MLQGLNQMGMPPSAAAASELGQPGDPPSVQAAVNGGIASPEAQGLLATNAANGQLAQAQAAPPPAPMTPALGPPPQMAGQTPVQPGPPTPTPPSVPGMPSPLGDTGAPPVGMAAPGQQQPGMQVQHPIVGQVLSQTTDPAMRQALLTVAQQAGFA
jgi:hypothetical protein